LFLEDLAFLFWWPLRLLPKFFLFLVENFAAPKHAPASTFFLPRHCHLKSQNQFWSTFSLHGQPNYARLAARPLQKLTLSIPAYCKLGALSYNVRATHRFP
jgi:hypothetical protein